MNKIIIKIKTEKNVNLQLLIHIFSFTTTRFIFTPSYIYNSLILYVCYYFFLYNYECASKVIQMLSPHPLF